jgi:hypothetical protein
VFRVDHTEESYEAAGDPSLDVISAYQRRVRRLRSLLLAETIVFLPLVIILATILILGRVERGQMAVIRFGTALELAVADEGTAYKVLEQYKNDSSGYRLPTQSIEYDPPPQVSVLPRCDVEPLSEMEALRVLRDSENTDFQVLTDAEVLFVKGSPVVAAPPDGVVQKAIDALIAHYSRLEGLVAAPKVVSEFEIVSERRHPSRLKFSADELVAEFEREVAPDVIERIGPGVTVQSVLNKHRLTPEDLQARNRDLDLSTEPPDGTALLISPGRDALEVEYQTREQKTTTVPPPVREIQDASMPKGETKVEQEGREGTAQVVLRITHRNDREAGWTVAGQEIVVEPREKVVRVGTRAAEGEAGAGTR